MAQKTKIREDEHGFYVRTGGYVCRSFGTCFTKGDPVKAHHFVGSAMIGVGCEDVSFKKKFDHGNPHYEVWSVEGSTQFRGEEDIFIDMNKRFKK